MNKKQLLKNHGEPIKEVKVPYLMEDIIKTIAAENNLSLMTVKKIFISQFYPLRLILNNADIHSPDEENLSIRLSHFGSFEMSKYKKVKAINREINRKKANVQSN
jgi:molybdopterin/thiamine biosynthesis adenylyltransferase